MTRIKLDEMKTEALVAYFAELGVAQDEALFHGKHSKYNRFYDKMLAIDGELRRRGLEARLALVALHTHPNFQVRLQAARWTLGVAREAARLGLQQLSDSKL
jgi:hypothetical protein